MQGSPATGPRPPGLGGDLVSPPPQTLQSLADRELLTLLPLQRVADALKEEPGSDGGGTGHSMLLGLASPLKQEPLAPVAPLLTQLPPPLPLQQQQQEPPAAQPGGTEGAAAAQEPQQPQGSAPQVVAGEGGQAGSDHADGEGGWWRLVAHARWGPAFFCLCRWQCPWRGRRVAGAPGACVGPDASAPCMPPLFMVPAR